MLLSAAAAPVYVPSSSAQAFQLLRVLVRAFLTVAILVGVRGSICVFCLFQGFTRVGPSTLHVLTERRSSLVRRALGPCGGAQGGPRPSAGWGSMG